MTVGHFTLSPVLDSWQFRSFDSHLQLLAALAVPPPEQPPLERIPHGRGRVPFDGA